MKWIKSYRDALVESETQRSGGLVGELWALWDSDRGYVEIAEEERDLYPEQRRLEDNVYDRLSEMNPSPYAYGDPRADDITLTRKQMEEYVAIEKIGPGDDVAYVFRQIVENGDEGSVAIMINKGVDPGIAFKSFNEFLDFFGDHIDWLERIPEWFPDNYESVIKSRSVRKKMF